MCELNLAAQHPFVFLTLYRPTRMLDSLATGEPIREFDGTVEENFPNLIKFLDNTLVTQMEGLFLKQGEKESFDLALSALIKMDLADDNDESRYLRSKPQAVLLDFKTTLQKMQSDLSKGKVNGHLDDIKKMQTFFDNVITKNYDTVAANRPRGCLW